MMNPKTWHLRDFLDRRLVAASLEERLPSLNAGSVAERVVEAAQRVLPPADDDARAVAVCAPGRIEFLGKHTDYAGGESLTCAVQRSFCMVAAATDEPGLRLFDQLAGIELYLPYATPDVVTEFGWSVYPKAVLRRFRNNFGPPDRGVALAFNSDIPRASGMSSSSAFVVGLWLAFSALNSVHERKAFRENIRQASDLAAYLGSIENGAPFANLAGDHGVGTRGGDQDHTAILYAAANELGHYGYRPLRRLGGVRIPDHLSFVVASSGVHASKTGGALEHYNRAVRLAERISAIWNRETGGTAATLREVVSDPAFSESILVGMIRQSKNDAAEERALILRARQFVEETREIIPGAMSALKRGDLEDLGDVVARSQRLADECLDNQVPETRFLVDAAKDCGAVAASAFGAGFGGSVYALTDAKRSRTFLRKWFAAYGGRFPERVRSACFFSDPTGPGAFIVGAEASELLLEPKL